MLPSSHRPVAGRKRWNPARIRLFLGLPVVVALVLVLGARTRPAAPRGAGDGVVRRMVSAMPRLDVGVRQAVHVTFAEYEKPAVGTPAQLKVVLTSGAADAEVEVRVFPPAGAAVTAGMESWSGRLAYQEQVEIPVSVALPDEQGAFVRAEVAARLPDGQTFTNATSVYVDPGAPDSPAPEPRTLIGMNGEQIPVVIYNNTGR
jgi:hypothetical protein